MIEIKDALLDEHAFVAKLALGVVLDPPQHTAELVQIPDFLNAHAAAAGRSLDQDDRIAHAHFLLEFEQGLGDLFGFQVVGHGLVRSGHGRHAEFAGQSFGVDLVAKLPDNLPGRPDENQLTLTLGHPPGKTVILGKKAVAGMNGRGPGLVGHGKDLVGIQIGTDPVQGLVSAKLPGQDTVFAVLVRFGEERHKSQAQLSAGLHDANGDLTPVGNENFMFFGFTRFVHVYKSLSLNDSVGR